MTSSHLLATLQKALFKTLIFQEKNDLKEIYLKVITQEIPGKADQRSSQSHGQIDIKLRNRNKSLK